MPEPVASTSAYLDEPDMSIFENKTGLAEDMKFLASMPELCDVTFLVGETREPVCAVKVTNVRNAPPTITKSVPISRQCLRLGREYSRSCCTKHPRRNAGRTHRLEKTNCDSF